MVIGLVVIGLLLIVLGIWIIRQTRVDLDVLAPLERMGDSEWKKRDRSMQRRMLDEVRPDGAQPLIPAKQPPSIDDEFELAEHPVTSFNDLGPGVALEGRDPTPVGTDAEPVAESDDEFDMAENPVTSFSDLGPGVPSEDRDSTPVGNDSELLIEPAAESTDPDVESATDPEAESATDPEAESDADPRG
jgi:hypothetical protein